MWYIALSHVSHRYRDASGGFTVTVCTSGGMGSKRVPTSLLLCEEQE